MTEHSEAISIGTPLSSSATKIMMLGSGELGKEVVIELQRYGVEVIAVDRYANAPAMQVAHRSHVIDMLDGDALRGVIELEKPDLVVPEIEAIATATLVELEAQGLKPDLLSSWRYDLLDSRIAELLPKLANHHEIVRSI